MNFRKIVLLLLAVLMVLSLVACANGGDENKDTTASAGNQGDNTPENTDAAETTASIYDKDGYLLDDIPDDIDYGGKTVNILFDQKQMIRTYTTDQTGDIINDALYYRLQSVEERLGVTLNFIPLEGAWEKRAEFAQAVSRSVTSGDKAYDLVCAYNLTPPTLAVQGILTNIYDLEGLNFEQPWWSEQLLTESVYDNKLFFCADNSSWNVIRNMHVIAYHRELVETLGIPNPMKTVIDGDWTMELLNTYIENGYKDLNGNGVYDVDNDQFALATDTKARLDGYFFAAGLHITTFNAEGVPEFALGDEKVQSYVEQMVKLYNDTPGVTLDSSQYKMFKDERAVFYETAIAISDQKLEFDYGILPIPKFDANQVGYVTGMSNTYDMWCIPNGVDDEEMCALVIECMASEAYRKVAPAYFETALKIKYASSGDAGEVFDIIRAGMTFDFGYVYGNNFTDAPFILVRRCITENTTGWSSKWAGVRKAYEKQLQAILKAISDN